MQSRKITRPRYYFLDGMRGIAALFVLTYHLGTHFGAPIMIPYGFLAVDFFFVLSGVVIASAYEGSIGSALSLPRFTMKRIIRLYPMIFMSVPIGFLFLMVEMSTADHAYDYYDIFLILSFNIILIPNFLTMTYQPREMFASNDPLWSLFFEFIVNIGWAAFLSRASLKLLLACCLGGLLLFGITAHMAGTTNVGWGFATFWGGLGRVIFGFLAGVILFRLRRWIPESRLIGPLLSLVILTLTLAMPIKIPMWGVIGATMAMPLAILCGMSASAKGLIPGEALLGRLSYPLYAIHMPLLTGLLMVTTYFDLQMDNRNFLYLAAIPIIMTAYALLILYDEPARKWLDRRLRSAMADYGARSTL